MTDRTLNDIAKNLKIARLQKRLTQDEVASKAGVSTNYYARLERAELKPSVEYLEKIVKALGVKSSDILPF
jgi:transcriptional regulator with XRE-family HTH domain